MEHEKQQIQKVSNPSASHASGMNGSFLKDNRKKTTVQLKSNGVVQLKNRIDLDKVADPKVRKIIANKLHKYYAIKTANKRKITAEWVNSPNATPKDESEAEKKRVKAENSKRDNTYNKKMEIIRKEYERAVIALAKKYKIGDKALVSGDAFYGDLVDEGNGVKFYRRPDTGEEYVKDFRNKGDNKGVFIPRYVRRELNKNDLADSFDPTKGVKDPIVTTGVSDDKGLKLVGGGKGTGTALTFEQREFLQQSMGGGPNQYAQSHTATVLPILSNAHDSFGDKKGVDPHPGAIITDLAKVDPTEIAAQWEMDPKTGAKIPLKAGVHETIGGNDNRDQTVRMSGYRNMEVLTTKIPKVATLQQGSSWHMEEGKAFSYSKGRSTRGEALGAFRKQKAAEVLAAVQKAKAKAEEERKAKEEAERKAKEEEERKAKEAAEQKAKEEAAAKAKTEKEKGSGKL